MIFFTLVVSILANFMCCADYVLENICWGFEDDNFDCPLSTSVKLK